MEPVCVLSWINEFKHLVGVHGCWQRELDDVARYCWVIVESADCGANVGCGCVRGQIFPDGYDSDLSTISVFTTDVTAGTRILTDKKSTESRYDAPLPQDTYPRCQFLLD